MSSKQGYFSRLDTLRFFAFFAVFISHVAYFMNFPAGVWRRGTLSNSFLQLGSLGVSFFFVLSGFLITHHLDKEHLSRKTISIKNFYIKRVLRIWPLYFLALALAAILSSTPLLRKIAPVNYKEFLAYIFLLGNWFRAFYGSANEMLSVLWSIAVEEQFYLFWPLVFFLFRKKINWPIFLGVAITFIFRWVYAGNYDVREYFSPCLITYFMIGGFYAIYAESINKKISRLKGFGTIIGFLWLAALLALRGLVFKGDYPNWFAGLEPLLYGVSFVLFIGHAVEHSQKPYLFSSVFEYLGKISYGLYVFHMMVFMVVKSLIGGEGFASFAMVFCSSLALTIIVSAISYKFWEKPFLALKHRFTFKDEATLSY